MSSRFVSFGVVAFCAVAFGASAASNGVIDAVRADDAGTLKALLKGGADPNTRDEGGVPVLVNAAAFCSSPCLRVLLDAGADVHVTARGGATALIWAAGEPGKVRLLLDHGAMPNVRLRDGTTALVTAVRRGELAGIRLLLARGADPKAAENETAELLRLAHGDRPQTRAAIESAGIELKQLAGRTPTLANYALSNGSAIESLLRLGASPNPRGRFPVLSLAVFQGQPVTAKILLENGTDPNAKGQHGVTPLMMAAAAPVPDPALVRFMIEKGSDRNARDDAGYTALDWALTQGDTPVVRVLRDAGAVASPIPQASAAASHRRPVRDAVSQAIDRLRSISPVLYEQRKCIACHHQTLPAMAMTAARARGIAVPGHELAHPIRAIVDTWNGRREDLMVGREVAGGANELTYGLLAFAEGRVPPNQATDAAVVNLLYLQRNDGSWVFLDTRPPQADNSPIPFTAMAIRGLQVYTPRGLRSQAKAAVERARAFVRSATPSSTQDEAFKLLGMVWGVEPRALISAQAKRVITRQRDSGGWGQLPTMTADAYATGETLYALHASGMSARDPVYQRGVDYLLRTQLDDGTWFVRSRAFGFQPYFESGFPHGRDQFISASATAWAVMALAHAL